MQAVALFHLIQIMLQLMTLSSSVSRKDVRTTSPSPTPPDGNDPDDRLQARLEEHFASVEGLDGALVKEEENSATHPEDVTDFEFRLFSRPSKGNGRTIQRITLDTPPRDDAHSSFVVSQRPRSFYFADVSPQRRDQLSQVAVTGDEIRTRARQRCVCHRPPSRLHLTR